MARSEQLATQDEPRANGVTRKDLYYPVLAIAVALAFAANAWFFYRQGQEDGANDEAAAMPAATIAWTRAVQPQAEATATQSDGNAAATAANTAQQPAATADETARAAASDAANAAKPAVKRGVRAKPANRMLAKVAKPAPATTTKPAERGVALLSHPKPAYPVPALRDREQGTVLVLAQVDVTGKVSDARIARHSGSSILDRAAMNEVRRWKFEPALHNGQPVVASVQVPVSYRLED